MEIVDAYSRWLSDGGLPKLFIHADAGAILTGAQLKFYRVWPD